MSSSSEVINLDTHGAARIDVSANSDAESTVITNPDPAVPFPSTALEDRRKLIIAFPSDSFLIGGSGVTKTTGLGVRGSGRGTAWNGQSNRHLSTVWSNRKQFLRGQYVALDVSDSLEIYGIVNAALEDAVPFELA